MAKITFFRNALGMQVIMFAHVSSELATITANSSGELRGSEIDARISFTRFRGSLSQRNHLPSILCMTLRLSLSLYELT